MNMHFTQQPWRPRKKRWFVLVRFLWMGAWQVAFYDEDGTTQLPLQLTFAFSEKLIALHEGWGVSKTLSDRADFEAKIESHTHGEFWVSLGPEEYEKLRIAKRRSR